MAGQFKWDKPTISVDEIVEQLAVQYGGDIPVGIPFEGSMSKQISFSSSIIPIHCNRCGADLSLTPKMVLTARFDRGYICSSCGGKTDSQVRNAQIMDRLEEGKRFLNEMGIDPEAEEEKRRLELEEEKALTYSQEDFNQMLEETGQRARQEEAAEAASPAPAPKPEKLETKVPEAPKQEDKPKVSKSKKGKDNEEAPPAPQQTKKEDPKPEPKPEPKKVEPPKPVPVEVAEETEDEDISTYEYSEEDDGSSISDFLGTDNNPEFSDEEEVEDVDDDVSPVFEEEETSAEDIADDFTDIVNDSEDDGDEETDEDEIADDATESAEASDPRVIVGGVAMTQDEIVQACTDTFAELYDKSILGYVPYSDSISVEQDGVGVKCNLCGNTMKIVDFATLIKGITPITKEYCLTRGLKYKGDVKLPYCPTCTHSYMVNGFNEHFRKVIERTFAKSKLAIVSPEKYNYADPRETFTVEANGIRKSYSYVAFVKAHGNEDMSAHPDFTPRATDTKSQAAPVVGSKESVAPKEYIAPKYDPNAQVHLGAVDSMDSLNKERSREQRAAEEAKTFKSGATIKRIKDVNAVDIDEFSKINPFERQRSLDDGFYKSDFAPFIESLANDTGVEHTLVINAKTYEIPLIDFKSGLRIICADLNERSIVNVPYDRIGLSVKFSYRNDDGTPMKYKYVVLFSDSIANRDKATYDALVKYINPKILAYGGERIKIGKLNVQYTDYPQILRDFDMRYSTFPSGKPKTGQLGIVAQWISNKKTNAKEAMAIHALMTGGASNTANLSSLESDYSQYMAASIRYITKVNQNTGRVVYYITEYVEIGTTIIADGLLLCIRALLNEYVRNFPQMMGIPPHIILELDPNTLISPSVIGYIKKQTLLPMDEGYRAQVDPKEISSPSYFGIKTVNPALRYSYVRKPEYRRSADERDLDHMRHDMRMFNLGTIVKRMSQEIKDAGLQNSITVDSVRLTFIANMGYVRSTQLEIKEFFVNQAVIMSLMTDGRTPMVTKLPDPEKLFAPTSGMVGDDNTAVPPHLNPNIMARYMRMMSNSTPEAQAYLSGAGDTRFMGMGMMGGMPSMQMGGMGMDPSMNFGAMPGMQMGMNPMMGGMPNMQQQFAPAVGMMMTGFGGSPNMMGGGMGMPGMPWMM